MTPSVKKRTMFSSFFLSLLLTLPAFSAQSIGIVGCGDELMGVEISQMLEARWLDATVVENLRGDAKATNFRVQRDFSEANSRRPGAPIVFKGKNFELRLVMLARRYHGQIRSHLKTVSAAGRPINQDILCVLN